MTEQFTLALFAACNALRIEMVESWRSAELEVVDTTYMSDLDY